MITGTNESWEPLTVDEVVATFAGADFRWWISGGHALELHCGRSWRSHTDVDVGIVRSDASLVRRWLTGWDLNRAAVGVLSPWSGTDLDPARSHNNIWARRTPDSAWNLDITVGDGDGDRWIYRRERSITRPWTDAVLTSADGVPYLAPDLQLLFKSKTVRLKDQLDAEQVVPALTEEQQRFLRSALPSDHRWQSLITSTASPS